MGREPRLHPVEVLASAGLHGGEGNPGSLPDYRYHSLLLVLHPKKLLEVGFLRLVARGHQLLLQRKQQDDEKIRSYRC